MKDFLNKVKEVLGRSVDESIWSLPVRAVDQQYIDLLVTQANSGSITRILTTLLASLYTPIAICEYVIQHPNYRPNPFVWIITIPTDVGLAIKSIGTLLEARAPPVGSEEERQLFDIYRSIAQIDSQYFSSNKNFD